MLLQAILVAALMLHSLVDVVRYKVIFERSFFIISKLLVFMLGDGLSPLLVIYPKQRLIFVKVDKPSTICQLSEG